jgi:ADP-heptose:LPS heptosyltransferase
MNAAAKDSPWYQGMTTAPRRGNGKLRVLDRYLGVPLVLTFGTLRSKQSAPRSVGRIGVLNTAAIGDTILMSASIADLREAHPGCEIVLMVGPSNYEAAQMIDGADTIVKLQVFNPLASLREIRKQRLDILLDFGPWSRLNALLSIFSRAPFIVGFRTAGQLRHFGYDLAVEHSGQDHELRNYQRLIEALGIKPTHRPELRYTREEQSAGAEVAPFVVFHMWPGGTGAELKEWPTARWMGLAEELTRLGYRIVLTGGADQRQLNHEFINGLHSSIRARVVNVAGGSLDATARLLLHAELVVSVNTGIMHLADALRVRLVALHGPTSAKRWGPTNNTSMSIESKLEGCGYLNLGFEYPPNPPRCMEAISFAQVVDACRAALSDRPQWSASGLLNGSRLEP